MLPIRGENNHREKEGERERQQKKGKKRTRDGQGWIASSLCLPKDLNTSTSIKRFFTVPAAVSVPAKGSNFQWLEFLRYFSS